MTYDEFAERLRKRFLDAEGQVLKDRPPEKKRRWINTICPKCKVQVKFSPKTNWDGLLKCGECGHEFRLSLLTRFTIRYTEVKDE